MIRQPRRAALLVAAIALLLEAGCAAQWAFRKGQTEAKKANWDLAVARLTKALSLKPDNINYKIALENARLKASRFHYDEAKKALAAEDLEKAAEELQIAANYDPSNQSASADLGLVRGRIRKREEEKARLADFDAMKARVQATRVPVPVLSARSPVPISLKFQDTSVQKILESLGKLAGVNVLFDPDYKDNRRSVDLTGVTFEEALNQITFVNRLFYKVLDANTLIIVQESPAKRKSYDENLVRTFYLQNAEVNETVQIIKALAGLQKAAGNPSLGAITVMGTPDELALAERIIDANDKARGEVLVEVNILEVNRTNLKRYGIELSNYEMSATFSPSGASGEVASGFTSVRAHLLSSINVSDFVVSIPSSLFARFLQTESTVRILAAPRLRAAEGKATELKIGTEVPIPVTTFTASAQGGNQTFVPATSFQYRNVGVNLKLTPRVSARGDITLELAAEFSLLGDDRNVGSAGNPLIVPTFLTRNVNGILRVKDGETSLIGGLFQGRDGASFRGALGLQGVPLLGPLLSSTQRTSDETEVLISLTPHLVRAPKLTEDDLRALYVGTKDVIRVPSARPSLFGPETSVAPAEPTPPPPTPMPAAPLPPPVPEEPRVVEPAPPMGARASTTRAVLSPALARVKQGDTTTVSVVVVGARGATAVDVTLSWDPELVEAVDVSPGTLLTLDGSTLAAERELHAGRGRARFGRAGPANGSGAVAVFRFKALKLGTSPIVIASLSLETAAGPEAPSVPASGQIVVEP